MKMWREMDKNPKMNILTSMHEKAAGCPLHMSLP
jgi:hypothetical protein